MFRRLTKLKVERISVRALAPVGEGIEPTERSSSGETSRAKKKSKTKLKVPLSCFTGANFCTALVPDSENTELTEPKVRKRGYSSMEQIQEEAKPAYVRL